MNFRFNESLYSEEQSDQCILWLPPLNKHNISKSFDWLCSFAATKSSVKKSPLWSKGLRETISEQALPLDETLPEQSKLLFVLPKGFKAQYALILEDHKWISPSDVFEAYKKVSATLYISKIQAPNIWNISKEALPHGVDWFNP